MKKGNKVKNTVKLLLLGTALLALSGCSVRKDNPSALSITTNYDVRYDNSNIIDIEKYKDIYHIRNFSLHKWTDSIFIGNLYSIRPYTNYFYMKIAEYGKENGFEYMVFSYPSVSLPDYNPPSYEAQDNHKLSWIMQRQCQRLSYMFDNLYGCLSNVAFLKEKPQEYPSWNIEETLEYARKLEKKFDEKIDVPVVHTPTIRPKI